MHVEGVEKLCSYASRSEGKRRGSLHSCFGFLLHFINAFDQRL
jgi:hypothetical protein